MHEKGYEHLIIIEEDGNFCMGLDKGALEKMYKYILDKNNSDDSFLDKLEKLHDKLEKDLDKAIDSLPDLKSLSDDELKKVFEEFCDCFDEAWKPFIFIDSFDLYWEEIINHLLNEEYNNKLTDDEVKTLLMPDVPSFAQEEEISLLKLKINFSEEGLERHQKKFFWYKNNYGHADTQPVSHFKEKLEKIKDPEKNLKEIEKKLSDLSNKKREIYENHDMPKNVLKFFKLMSSLGHRRDVRKRINCKGDAILRWFVEEIARRKNIDWRLYEQLPFINKSDKLFTISEEELKKIGHKVSALFSRKDDPAYFYGDEAEEIKKVYDDRIKQEFKELKGQIANKGIVKGRVKIIMKQDEFSKMEEGDILVSYMTRPEFVPIMKKAAAIITNEGGITSHAAIVSRELGKPCIIGTQVATKVLKDGDLVEVDADHGIVRKIE
ncbi:hypothetical protein CEE44_04810 [Candidatus Woesearchaeota archaeon B3_Woes]|nr:MAG: hypothetical protein CEE44_04810 [Candidatus Woesearchaeota archaeon B3_Woes]